MKSKDPAAQNVEDCSSLHPVFHEFTAVTCSGLGKYLIELKTIHYPEISMRRTVLSCLGVATLLALSGGQAFAHHAATATYMHGKTMTIEGTLKEFLWRNPHSFMKVEAPDDKGVMQLWLIEGAAPTQLADGGVTKNSLHPGDHLIVTGQPGRVAEDHRMLLEKIERPSDGFKWQGKSE